MGFFFEKSESMTESKSESMTEGRTGESTFERGYLGETEASQVTADAYSDGGYDGSVMSDVFENYDKVRKGNGYAPLHFMETRKNLQRIRDQRRQIQKIGKQINALRLIPFKQLLKTLFLRIVHFSSKWRIII